MTRLISKIKPVSGVAHILHIILTIGLPLLLFIFVRLELVGLAAGLILISKWRMLAVKPRHWPANVRSNAIDLIVGLSVLVFMSNTTVGAEQLIWAVLYGLWLVALKPKHSTLAVAIQALIGQTIGLTAMLLNWGDASLFYLVIGAWAICYSGARHFFTAFDESLTSFMSHVWAYFAAALMWILGHWLIFYGSFAQPTLLLTIISIASASLYYLETNDKLSLLLRRQVMFILLAVIVVVLAFSEWGDKAL